MEKVMNNSKLTSVKILEDLYKRFKQTTVNTKMTLQKLTNRSIDLYLTDDTIRKNIAFGLLEDNIDDDLVINKVRDEVTNICLEYPLYKD